MKAHTTMIAKVNNRREVKLCFHKICVSRNQPLIKKYTNMLVEFKFFGNLFICFWGIQWCKKKGIRGFLFTIILIFYLLFVYAISILIYFYFKTFIIDLIFSVPNTNPKKNVMDAVKKKNDFRV